ncbi:CHAD domain-containing protein [Streptomyces sp. NPDC049577]|uniref:CHAD domain-containing protein n=1 Tax=Streptomyces sp. NPDC049577 TaxID=3155153 RepID=UPI0034156040
MGVEVSVALGAYVRRERDRLVSREPLVRRNRSEAVKAMRNAARRLGSVWCALEETGSPDTGLVADCSWLREHLSAVRHLDVTGQRVLEHPAMTGAPAQWAAERLARSRDPARRELVRILDGPRYKAFVAALDAKADGPVPEAAAGLGDRFRAAWRPLVEELAAASAIGDDDARADALHEVRKRAKPMLDTGRGVERAYPELLRHPLRVLAALQGLLGEHQDSTVCRHTLLEWAGEAPDGHVREALYGLVEHERAAAAAVEARLPALYTELSTLRFGR